MVTINIVVPDENVANYIKEQIDEIVLQYLQEKSEKTEHEKCDYCSALESDLAYARRMRAEAEENEGKVRRKLAQYDAYFSRIKSMNNALTDLLVSFE
ncbi:MAG: hypothetical protein AB7F25_06870 [Deferribacterales bacterium]